MVSPAVRSSASKRLAVGGQEGEGELGSVEGLECQVGDGLFDFYGVHRCASAPRALQHRSNRCIGLASERSSTAGFFTLT
jgi:hypothetical protein